MKTRYILFAIAFVIGLGACEMRNEMKGHPNKQDSNEGWMTLDLSSNSAVELHTRSNFPAEDINVENYTVRIVEAETENLIKEISYKKLMEEESGEIKLGAGKYKIIAYNYDGSGDTASERPYFRGETNFQILAGKKTTVNTTCRVQNIIVTLALSDEFKTLFNDNYEISVTNKETGVYLFNKENADKRIYFNVPLSSKSMGATIKATTKTNLDITETYTITKPENAENSTELMPGDAFHITINPGDEPSVETETKIELNIKVDLEMTETGKVIEIPTGDITQEPGEGGDGKGDIKVTGLNKTYTFDVNKEDVTPVQVQLTVPNGIKNLFVEIGSDNTDFMGTLTSLGLNKKFDLVAPGDLASDLADLGLINPNDPIKGKTSYLFDITGFMSMLKLFGVSNNTFSITISDGVTADVKGDLRIKIIEGN